ncbi:MAG: hypothetical protein IJK28_04800 [Clostridia bacterium]|nr:hypothetical protein [Clostridia bacterium]
MNEPFSFEDLLREKGSFVYTNVGISMMPLLRQHRDIIEIRKKGIDRCKKYDAVLYKRGKKYILHRIVKVRADDYVIVGDNCIWREYGITDDDILGVMTRVVRNGRTIDVNTNKLYKFYVHLWCDFYHVRAGILAMIQIVKRLGHMVKKALHMDKHKEREN